MELFTGLNKIAEPSLSPTQSYFLGNMSMAGHVNLHEKNQQGRVCYFLWEKSARLGKLIFLRKISKADNASLFGREISVAGLVNFHEKNKHGWA